MQSMNGNRRFLVLAFALCLQFLLARAAFAGEYSYPVAFEKFDSVLANPYETYRLPAAIKQEPGSPLVLEAEHASKIELHGAEQLAFLSDAVGGVAVRQIKEIYFTFETVTPGTYTMWLRCKGRPGGGVSGPNYVVLDGRWISSNSVKIGRTDKKGVWMWVKGTTQDIAAGTHHLQLRANLFLYGACIDRILLAGDQNYIPDDNDTGPSANAVAVRSGSAISSVIDAKGVRKWKRIWCRKALAGGKVTWRYKPEGSSEWKEVSEDDVSSIPADSPFRLKMTLACSLEKMTPIVDTVRLAYEGEPLRRELAPGVLYEALPDGGCVVSSDIYRATFAPTGRISSIKMDERELMVTGDSGWSGWWTEFGRDLGGSPKLVPLSRPDLTPDNRIAVRTDEIAQLFEFHKNRIRIALSEHGGNVITARGTIAHVFKINPNLDIDRIVEKGTGKVIEKGREASNTPQVFFRDGSSFIVNPVSVHLPSYIRYYDGPDRPAYAYFVSNRENFNTIGLTFTIKPGESKLLEQDIVCAKENHVFEAGKPVTVMVNSLIPRNLSSFEGSGKLILKEMYVPKDRKPQVFEKTIPLNVSGEDIKKPIIWKATLRKPGHYYGEYQLIKDGNAFRSESFYILYGPEADRAKPPRDFDAFWKRTMSKLERMPRTFERLSTKKQNNFILSRITFKTIDEKDAWGSLAEPKAEGKYPAILKLPAVFHHYGGGIEPKPGFVVLGCDVMGFDPNELNPFSEEARKIYQPWQKSVVKKPEEFWLYYAYCTIARAYDILENHPKVDRKRIYITGISQGGGLTLAAAGLRPQNAGALSVVPGLCRIKFASEGRGAWGPTFKPGPHFAEMQRMAKYFETAYLVKNIRSRLVMFIGLRDDHTPPYAAATVFYHIPKNIKERKLIVDPEAHHQGREDLYAYIPRWTEEDEK